MIPDFFIPFTINTLTTFKHKKNSLNEFRLSRGFRNNFYSQGTISYLFLATGAGFVLRNSLNLVIWD